MKTREFEGRLYKLFLRIERIIYFFYYFNNTIKNNKS